MQVPGFWWDTSWGWLLFVDRTGFGPSPPSSFIITEGGDPIITESGDRLITE